MLDPDADEYSRDAYQNANEHANANENTHPHSDDDSQ